jgi:hypothetical protein
MTILTQSNGLDIVVTNDWLDIFNGEANESADT